MKEQNNIDKLFSDGLQDLHVNYDENEVWENIQNEKQKKRGFIWFWWGGAGALFLLLSVFYFFNIDENTQLPNAELLKNNPSEVAVDNMELLETEQVEEKSIAGISTDEKNILVKLKDLQTEDGIQKSREFPTNQDLWTNERSLKNSKSEESKNENIFSSSDIDKVDSKTKKDQVTAAEEIIQSFAVVKEVKNEALIGAESNSINSNSSIKKENSEIESADHSIVSSEIKHREVDLFPWQPDQLATNFPNEIKPDFTIFGAVFQPRFSLQYYGTIYRPKTRYDYLGNAIRTELENSSNQDMVGYSNRLLFGYKVNDWFSVSTGIEQMQIFSKFYLEQIEGSSDFIYNENAFFIEDNGNTTAVGDSVFAFVSMKRIRQSQQILNLYNIPVGVQFQQDINKWIVGSSVYAVINIHHSFTGFRFDRAYKDIIKHTRNTEYFTNNLAGSIEFSPYVAYRLNEKFSVNIRANMRWDRMRSISDELKVQSRMLGVGVGVEYALLR